MKRVFAFACALALCAGARGEQIVVSNYAVTTNGMPFAVAMEKGYFKEFKVQVDGILTSDGGGTTIRNLLGGKLSYGEAAVSAVVSAVQGGADLKIISGNVHTVAEFVWVAMPKSPVNSLKDLKGRKLGYTNPRSTSQALAILIMESQKLKENEAKLDIDALFPAGSDKGDTKAAPKVWEDMAGFKAANQKLIEATDAALAAPPQDVGALGAAMGGIGGACGGCHKEYRLPS